MVQSLNTKVDIIMEGTSFSKMNNYGKIMVGDKGFEYYSNRNVNDFIQIPWEEVDYIVASVMFRGKYIPRFALQTKKNGNFTFSAKKPKELLGVIRHNKYVPSDHMVRSLTFFQVLRRALPSRKGKK
ncbi:MAG: DUF956 family protein [Clostridiales bacterium]|nr:DUF956 family protein [Clostridiales bacterium]